MRFTIEIERKAELSGYYHSVLANLAAAAELWARHIDSDAAIDIHVDFRRRKGRYESDRASAASRGCSTVSRSYRWHDGRRCQLIIDGAAHTLATGRAPQHGRSGIVISLPPDYLANEMWFDSDPSARSARVARRRVDAVSVFLHELGHGLGLNSRLVPHRGTPHQRIISTFDRHVRPRAGGFVFTGPAARAEHGGPVPLDPRVYSHLGTGAAAEGALRRDLMTAAPFRRGARYHITRLDLAILKDVGVPIRKESLA